MERKRGAFDGGDRGDGERHRGDGGAVGRRDPPAPRRAPRVRRGGWMAPGRRALSGALAVVAGRHGTRGGAREGPGRDESLQGADPREMEECRRFVVTRSTDDGMVSIEIWLHPEEAARVMKGLEAAADELGDGLSADTSRRLLCDAGVVPVLADGAGRTID